MIDMELIKQGLEVTGLGLGGVFLVLMLFYGVTKLMNTLSEKYASKEEQDT